MSSAADFNGQQSSAMVDRFGCRVPARLELHTIRIHMTADETNASAAVYSSEGEGDIQSTEGALDETVWSWIASSGYIKTRAWLRCVAITSARLQFAITDVGTIKCERSSL